MKPWKEFEQVVASIQRQMAPDAKVEADRRIRGRSGRLRQIDISLEHQCGPYTILIIVECKKYNRPVSMKDVADVSLKCTDVGAGKAVIVSSAGFTEGARAVAAQHSMLLLTYREATHFDWTSLIGENAGLSFVVEELIISCIEFPDLVGSDETLTDEDTLVTLDGGVVCTVGDLRMIFATGWGKLMPLGPFTQKVVVKGSLFLSDSPSTPIGEIIVQGSKVALEYIIPMPRLQSGHVLADEAEGTTLYRQVMSEEVRWREVASKQPGYDLSASDYMAGQSPAQVSGNLQVSEKDGVLRVVVTDHKTR